MSASTAGAIKAHLETLGLGVAVHRDEAPEDATLPYIVVTEGISITRDATFNPRTDDMARELVQIDVYDLKRNAANQVTESYTLPDAVRVGVNGVRLATAPKKVYGMVWVGSARIPDPDSNVIRHAITAEVRRAM